MFEKTIIYLLFPTIFSPFSPTPEREAVCAETPSRSNKEIIDIGVNKVKLAIESVSIEQWITKLKSDSILPISSPAKCTDDKQ